MSDFRKSENEQWQREVRAKIEDLVAHVEDCDGDGMTAFAIDFIESVSQKLAHKEILVSPKQYEVIWNLWDQYVGVL